MSRRRMMMQSGVIEPPLPQEYQAVEGLVCKYLKTYIFTRISTSRNIHIEIEFLYNSSNTDVVYFIAGTDFSQGGSFRIARNYSQKSLTSNYINYRSLPNSLQLGTRYKVILENKGEGDNRGRAIIIHNDVVELNYENTSFYITDVINMSIISNEGLKGNYLGYNGYLYGLSLEDRDTKKKYKFVPCYKKDNPSVGGLYELYTGVFYTSNGSEDFGVL